MKRILTGSLAAMASLALFLTAAAAYTTGGDAVLTSPGNASGNAVRLSSDSTLANGFSFVSFPVPAGLTVADLSALSADYLLVDGDCGGGSPRFSIGVDTDGDTVTNGRIFIYIGPAPNYTGCAAGWQTTGNLVGTVLVDASQLGGAFYESWANVLTLVGDDAITSIAIVVDGSWLTDPQTFDFDNVDVNGTVETFEPNVPESSDDCKNGGWTSLTRADFSSFKNQGDCIQFVNTGK